MKEVSLKFKTKLPSQFECEGSEIFEFKTIFGTDLGVGGTPHPVPKTSP